MTDEPDGEEPSRDADPTAESDGDHSVDDGGLRESREDRAEMENMSAGEETSDTDEGNGVGDDGDGSGHGGDDEADSDYGGDHSEEADDSGGDGGDEGEDYDRDSLTPEEATPIERKAGPEYDDEQPLADHIEEMIKRLAIVVVVAGLVSVVAFPVAENAIIFLWHHVLPDTLAKPHVYHPLELVLTQLKTASLAGLIIALPVFVYQTYAFMRPGLYPHERRYYLAAVPTSLLLALVGVTFAYFIVLPSVMNYFLYYSRDVVDIAFALGRTFDLILVMMGYLALVFQIPLFIMLAIMMGLTTREWLQDRRLIVWGAFLGLAFLFSPDPTGMAPIIIAATMIVLFEGTLLLLRWTDS